MTVTLEEAQRTLPALFDRLAAGGHVTIERADGTAVRLAGRKEPPRERRPRRLGTARGNVRDIDEGDRSHLEGFRDDMFTGEIAAGQDVEYFRGRDELEGP